MKVLFAVSDEEISEAIVKRYQKEYKEIISYKNVYYFNAIIKELQKDKNYDRIVISEELEAFVSSQYDQIDKFIFEKLDRISDEAANLKGDDIPIILICSDRREKEDEILGKLFGIGVYSALLGNDRSVENVCNLLKKPRVKKEAKLYYKIDVEGVSYQSENENDVSEVELQNILAHYKRLGKDEKRYVDSYNNIATQYNDIQLRIIGKFLPVGVRAVLEEKCPKYQQVMAYNNKVSDNIRVKGTTAQAESGVSEKLLKNGNKGKIFTKPVVIPSVVNTDNVKKVAKSRSISKQKEELINKAEEVENNIIENDIVEMEEKTENVDAKKRGRPRKNPIEEENAVIEEKKKRGRPKKNVVEDNDDIELPIMVEDESEEIEEKNAEVQENEFNDIELPIFSDEDEKNPDTLVKMQMDNSENISNSDDSLYEFDEIELPQFEDDYIEKEEPKQEVNKIEEEKTEFVEDMFENEPKEQMSEIHDEVNVNSNISSNINRNIDEESNKSEEINIYGIQNYINSISSNGKVVCFLGTSKNGTSFIVNSLAEIASKMGINTAILDMTKNKNSYYFYTDTQEELRRIASECMQNLEQGVAEGIKINNNMTVYTAIPEQFSNPENAEVVYNAIGKKHSLILVDCDYETPYSYFDDAQELYLVQSYDILTIQPLTAFLQELKVRNILKEEKLRIILNKVISVKGLNEKRVIGGMAVYTDPGMSYMTELFDKNAIRYITIPFDYEVYMKYLSNTVNCEMSTKGYPRKILQIFDKLVNMIFPEGIARVQYKNAKNVEKSTFSPSINSTLEQMKKKY